MLAGPHYREGRHFVSGNMGFLEWTVTGTTLAGARVEVRGTEHHELLDGKVIRKDSYWKIVEGRIDRLLVALHLLGGGRFVLSLSVLPRADQVIEDVLVGMLSTPGPP